MKNNTIIFRLFIDNIQPFVLVHITDKIKLYNKDVIKIIKNNNLMNDDDEILIDNTHVKYIKVQNNKTFDIKIIKKCDIKKNNKKRLNIDTNINITQKKCIFMTSFILSSLPIIIIILSNSILLNLIVIWLLSIIGFVFFIFSMLYYESSSKIEKENIRLSEINEIKNLFLANMSHELKTPLSNILGLTTLLLEKKDNIITKEEYDYFKHIKESSENMFQLISDILLFSKSVGNNIQLENLNFDLDNILLSIIKIIAIKIKEKNIKLYINDDIVSKFYFPYFLIGDPNKLKHILINLITNAIKFSPNNSNINIFIDFTLKQSNRINIIFKVIDNGIGISDEQIMKIFLPFQQADISTTRKYGGTGLGLSICNQLIKKMKGNMIVKSKKEEGSEFKFNIIIKVDKKKEITDNNVLLETDNINFITDTLKTYIYNSDIKEEEEEEGENMEIVISNAEMNIKDDILFFKTEIQKKQINILINAEKKIARLICIFLKFKNINIIKSDNIYFNDIDIIITDNNNFNFTKKNDTKILLIYKKDIKMRKNKNINKYLQVPIKPYNFYKTIYELI